LPAGRRAVPAPIQSVQFEAGNVVAIVATLPNGCAMRHTQDVQRQGNTFTISILNSEPTGNQICTTILRTYEVKITLTSLTAGQTYTVRVNDKQATFTAR
jgi:hypothetical protein